MPFSFPRLVMSAVVLFAVSGCATTMTKAERQVWRSSFSRDANGKLVRFIPPELWSGASWSGDRNLNRLGWPGPRLASGRARRHAGRDLRPRLVRPGRFPGRRRLAGLAGGRPGDAPRGSAPRAPLGRPLAATGRLKNYALPGNEIVGTSPRRGRPERRPARGALVERKCERRPRSDTAART